jgi:hypothetical protein
MASLKPPPISSNKTPNCLRIDWRPPADCKVKLQNKKLLLLGGAHTERKIESCVAINQRN